MKINQAIKIYLQWKSSYAPVAANRYAVRLREFTNYLNPEKNLSEITGDNIIAFNHFLEKQQYSLSTIAYSSRILKNFFEFWKGRGKAKLNPKEIIPIRYITPDRAIVNLDDLNDMDEALEENNLRDLQIKLLIHLLWDSGMRVSELVELNMKDISKRDKNGLRTAHVRTRKTMRYNLVMWGKETNRLLEKYLANRLCKNQLCDALFVNFRNKEPKRITTRTVQRWIEELLDLTSIQKKITPHSFRHGKAHHLLDNGANVRDVQAILRHANPISSFHYMTLNEAKYTKMAAKYLV